MPAISSSALNQLLHMAEEIGEIKGTVNGVDGKLDTCQTAIGETREYQKVQNGRLADALAEIAQLKEAARGAAAAAKIAADSASLASKEIVNLKESAADMTGERRGVGETWKWMLLGVGVFIDAALTLFHIIHG